MAGSTGSTQGEGLGGSRRRLGEGRSRFDVTFSLGEDHAYLFTGGIEAEGNGAALAELTDEGTGTYPLRS